MVTLILVAICVVIVIKFRSKRGGRRHGNGGDATTTEADKGSAEPLSRNMGSHSSLEDKNPDVVPQEANSEDEFHQEEKAFDRLNMESQRILYTPPTRISTASPPPPSLSPTFGKQVSQLFYGSNFELPFPLCVLNRTKLLHTFGLYSLQCLYLLFPIVLLFFFWEGPSVWPIKIAITP